MEVALCVPKLDTAVMVAPPLGALTVTPWAPPISAFVQLAALLWQRV